MSSTTKPRIHDRSANKTRENILTSPLLRLPAELRNKIYEQYFAGLVYRVHQTHMSKCNLSVMVPTSHIQDPVALLLTCRQTNFEASTMLYAVPTFSFRRFGVDPSMIGYVLEEKICSRVTSMEIDRRTARYMIYQSALLRERYVDMFPTLKEVYVYGSAGDDQHDIIAKRMSRTMGWKGMGLQVTEGEKSRYSRSVELK
ncbi:hypothetical protein NX059_009054 [Plenodomus lindquistii]|nr:hypothetical protein NX059_009054 [Plenodomus lindquistii]